MAWWPGYGWGWGGWGGWGGGWRRGWRGPWPGNGPFSYLPPWQRPGWIYGRGACRWLFAPYYGYWYRPPYYAPWGYGWYAPPAYYPWW